MIGLFMRNAKDQVRFVHIVTPEAAQTIASFHYTASNRIMTATYADGEEESFTTEMEDIIHDALVDHKSITVARKTDVQEAGDIYDVPLTFG